MNDLYFELKDMSKKHGIEVIVVDSGKTSFADDVSR